MPRGIANVWQNNYRRIQLSTIGDRAFPMAGSKPPLEQSAARRHLSSNAERLKTYLFFPIISFLAVFGF